MKNTNKLILFAILCLIIFAIDWYTKNWAKRHLFYVQSKSYFNGIFTLDYAENKGAALSFGSNLPDNQAFIVLQILPALILVALLYYVFKNLMSLSVLLIISFACVFSGGLANLIDRFLNNRHVIDFMIVEWYWFKTGIFNFADVFISLGVIGLLFSTLHNKES